MAAKGSKVVIYEAPVAVGTPTFRRIRGRDRVAIFCTKAARDALKNYCGRSKLRYTEAIIKLVAKEEGRSEALYVSEDD